MLKMVDGTGIIGLDMVCPLGGAVSPPQPPNYDKIEMEGVGSLMLPNSLKAPLERVELIGNSEQATTKGVNLIPYKVGAKIESFDGGNTAAFKEDGVEITIKSADSTSKGDIYFFGNYQGNIEAGYSDKVKAGDYTILSNSKLCTFYVVVWRNGTSKIIINNSDEQMIHFTVLDGDKIRLFLRVKQSIGTEKAQIMLCKHTDANLPYEPYTGLKPSPSPEYPQEIKSAGRKSKNLLNLQKQPDVKETHLGWKVSDGRNVALSVKDKGNNADITGCYLGLSRTGGSADGVVWVVKNGSVAVKEVVSKNQYVSVFPSNETTVRKLLERFDIQVEYGNNATDYEPYGYFLDVKVTGKNLLDIKDITSETPQWLEIPCLIKNNIYIKSNNSTVLVESNQARLIVCFKDGTSRAMYDNSMTNGLPFKANSENPITTIKVRGTHIKSGVYSGIQVEYGNEPTPYEPYTEQSVQIALDEPLRGIGEYKDVLTKDGVVRKIHEQTLKKEQISMNAYNWDTKYFRLYVIPDKKIDSSINNSELFSNMFKKFVMYRNNPTVYWIISEEEIRSMGITEADSRQVAYEKIKDFVTTNDIVIQYPIVESTLEPLPESVQAQLQALHTENGTTHVFVDSEEVPCGIKLTYRKEI